MEQKKPKIAIIGCGGIAKNAHMNSYRELNRFEVVAACDILPDRAKAFAEANGIPQYFTDYHDVLKLEGLDAVDICTPNYLHSIIAVDALNAGLNVLCEKPDAINPVEAEKMKAAAEKNGKLLMVIRNNRFANHSIFLKKYIEEGKLGHIYDARCGWQRRRGIPARGGWVTTQEQSGGGPLIDLGVHMIDLTMWLMGNPTPVAVSGCTYTAFANNRSESTASKYGDVNENGTFDVEDLAMGFIRFDNGACLQIEFSWASNIERDNKFYELRGTEAGASWSFIDDTLRIFKEECGTNTDLTPKFKKPRHGHVGNIENFADALEGKAEPVFKPQQGIDMIKILCAIYESAKTGKEVIL